MPQDERLLRLTRGSRCAHACTARLERLGEERARRGVVVDDEKLEVRARQCMHDGGPPLSRQERNSMNARSTLQDSGLPDSRLLARLLQAGTLVLDENDMLTFA